MKNSYLSSSLNSVVSLDMDSSWAAKSWDLSNIYWNQNGNQVNIKKAFTTDSLLNDQNILVGSNFSRGKVRQLFLERRGKGWDRSNPLEPIKSKSNKTRGNSPLHNSPSFYSNSSEKIELFNPPVRLPNIGVMQSQRDIVTPRKGDKASSKIPQPRSTAKSYPTEELKKMTLSPHKGSQRCDSPGKTKLDKAGTPGPSSEISRIGKKIPSADKPVGIQRGNTASVKSRTVQPTAQKTPLKALDPDMDQCTICGRSFLKERLKVHEGICKKSSVSKRKVFDPVKHRLSGTEAESYLRRGASQARSTTKGVPKPKGDWRKKHEEFIATIRAAKQVQDHLAKGGNIRDLPPPPPMDTSDYIQCQHCGRKFNAAVADRHIPICSKVKSNKPPAKRGGKK